MMQQRLTILLLLLHPKSFKQMTNGLWGCISVGLFAKPELMDIVYNNESHVGWFYEWARGSGDGTLLACQLVGILFVAGWVIGTMAPFFWMLHYFGYLR
jgi:Amt family ammonium transporter